MPCNVDLHSWQLRIANLNDYIKSLQVK